MSKRSKCRRLEMGIKRKLCSLSALPPLIRNNGCILLGLFWLLLFRFMNNRIYGISISKRTLLHVSDLLTELIGDLRTTISAHATGAGDHV